MKRGILAALVAVVVLGAGFAAATAVGGRSASAAPGKLSIRVGISSFVRVGKGLAAHGSVVAQYVDASGVVHSKSDPFHAKVLLNRKATATTCKVLYLELDRLSLQLLGLDVNLDKVILTIDGDSSGGALGALFCKLANTQVGSSTSTASTNKSLAVSAQKMTRAGKKAGLSKAMTLGVPLSAPNSAGATGGTGATGATGAVGPCKVLDLVLGPLNLDLLGLIVTLNQVHLTITATPGAVLGNLFCSLAGGTGPTGAPPTTAASTG